MGAADRAQAVYDATRDMDLVSERGDRRLELDAPPDLLVVGGRTVGVECRVRLFDGDVDQRVDPQRQIINPPTQVWTDFLGWQSDPLEAFWSALWDQVGH